jgi:hypothetical protein
MVLDLEVLSNSSKYSQQRCVRHNRYYVTAISDDYGGTKQLSFASFTVHGSRNFPFNTRVFLVTRMSRNLNNVSNSFTHYNCLSVSPC